MTKIMLQKLPNTRDLGGIKTIDGSVIQPKRLIRSGKLYSATQDDINKLIEEYHLERIIDFRTDVEREESEDPMIKNIEYIPCPILDKHYMNITADTVKKENLSDLDSLKQMIELMHFDVESFTAQFYPNLVLSDYSKKHYAKFLNILIDEVDGATLYHCSAGKDRVGIGTALLLCALGVDKETIINDFLETNNNLSAQLDYYLHYAKENNLSEEYIKNLPAICGVKLSYIQSVYTAIEENYGSLENYINSELGFSQEKCNLLKDKYLVK